MDSKNIRYNTSKNETLKPIKSVDFCDVSKASVAIMLDRFCNGKDIDFPFSQ